MTVFEGQPTSKKLSRERLIALLQTLLDRGLSQQQVAARSSLPAQYLSDIKCGRRPMTELVARRLGDELGYDFRWLLGIENSVAPTTDRAPTAGRSAGIWLPLFPHPIEGDPKRQSAWDGTGIEIAGTAAAQLGLARWPYVLRFRQKKNVQDRLRNKDLVLISQSVTDDPGIKVVKHRGNLYLARPRKGGGWVRIANGDHLPEAGHICGYCLGIIWSSLIE